MNALHLMMLPVNGPAPEFAKKVLDSAQIKLENYINHGLEPDLSKEEETALLYSPEILKKRIWLCVWRRNSEFQSGELFNDWNVCWGKRVIF